MSDTRECDDCGGEIIFRYVGGQVIPIHLSGGCGWGSGYGASSDAIPSSSQGQTSASESWRRGQSRSDSRERFTHPTTCPICGAFIFFHTNGFGDAVFFDSLGWPWPKHPCLSSEEGRRRAWQSTELMRLVDRPRPPRNIPMPLVTRDSAVSVSRDPLGKRITAVVLRKDEGPTQIRRPEGPEGPTWCRGVAVSLTGGRTAHVLLESGEQIHPGDIIEFVAARGDTDRGPVLYAERPEVVSKTGRLLYFETSAWNRLAERQDRAALIDVFRRNEDQVFASVITAGEILRTGDEVRRKLLCEVMETLHGNVVPLLDHPEHLACYAAEAWLRGDVSIDMRESGGASTLYAYLKNPDSLVGERRQEVDNWIRAMSDDQTAVFEDLANIGPRAGPAFCSPSVLDYSEFNELFAKKAPVARELGLTGQQVGELAARSDVWKAYRAMVAFIIDAALDRMPEIRPNPSGSHPQRRPGGADLRQATYLGVCDTFVLRDDWLQDALTQIAAAARLNRHIVSTDEFFTDLLRPG